MTLPTFERHLERVVEETCKASAYLTAALAYRILPRLQERWEESPTQLAFVYLRQGAHMAFLVTLAALLEENAKTERVSLPSLLTRLDDQQIRGAIASKRGWEANRVYARCQMLQSRFQRRIAPLIPRAKDVRDNVVAHFGKTTDWPATKVGTLTRLMIRSVVMVDAVHELATGEETTIRETLRSVRYQSASLWFKRIDGDPDICPGIADLDE